MVCDAKCRSSARLDGKTVVITGSNTGIGKETVKDFYKRGGRVIMACRNLEKTQEAADDVKKQCEGQENLGNIVVLKLDLNSLKSVRECAQKILDNEQRVDILVNNAGVMICPEGKTEEGFETQFGTNHLGHYLFTMLLLPRIIKSRPARIVNVSSAAHTFGEMDMDDLNWQTRPYSPWQAYCSSKMANIHFTKELARKLKDHNISDVHTYSLHPGAVATDLQRHVGTTMFPGADFIQKYIMRPLFFKTPEQGAQTTIYCSVDEKAGQETGLYYAECKPKEPSAKVNKLEDADKLWKLSWKMVGLNEDYNPFVSG